MRTAIRLVVFAAIVAVIALTLAPPIDGQTASVDPSGTYTGTLVRDDGGVDGGVIVVTRDNGELTINAGPSAEQLWRATKVELVGDTLRFEVVPPGDTPPLFQFDVKVEAGKMTGKATMTRDDGSMSTVTVAFTRQ